MPVFSHKFAISFINVIFVAKKAFEAYFINSAARLDVFKYCAPFEIKGLYKFLKIRFVFLSFDPTTILSGKVKSLIASPSLKNSGLETTENFFLEFFFEIIFSISSPVVTGTVDLVMIILNLFIEELTYFSTL